MNSLRSLAAACAAIGATVSTALAGGPAISLLMSANGQSAALSLTGNPTSTPDVFNYAGSAAAESGGWIAAWNFNAANAGTDEGLDHAFTAGNFVVVNTSNSTVAFDFVVSMPIAFTGPGLYGGSVSASLTTQGAGSFLDVGGAPVWTATTGGQAIATLLGGPVAVSRTTAGSSSVGSDSFGEPIPSMPGPNFAGDLTIRLQFTLTAGASASFTSVLVGQVPAPGAAVLLGLAGLVGPGRRRRR
jgi:hypothetical protein